jgi:AraC-like DNA-binding protein
MKQNEVMSSCLDHVTDWAALDKGGNYCATKIVSSCGVTPRQMERHIQAMGRPAPHRWLRDLRMRQAVEMMSCLTPLKIVAIDLGYKDPSHFAHDFKGCFGVCLTCFSQYHPLAVAGRPNVALGQAMSHSNKRFGFQPVNGRPPAPYLPWYWVRRSNAAFQAKQTTQEMI